jgi:SpoVK/Ycf46/Vps4 family AAA+-type ATPase
MKKEYYQRLSIQVLLFNLENIKVGLADLILPSSTKLVLQTIVTLPLLRPEFFSKGVLSRSSIHGVLLFGPPGTGKTMLAKAIAKCSGAWFLNVSLSDIFDKYVGEGEKNVRAVFTLARKLGGPVVIFLDEVDAVFGTRRSDGSGSSRREVMNEFMAEWDGYGFLI